jgi:hypothetical protein
MRNFIFLSLFGIFALTLGAQKSLAQDSLNQSPYNGTPSAIPGDIKAVEFDLGAKGEAYNVLDEAYGGALNSIRQDVSLPIRNDGDGDYIVLIDSSWVEYTVNFATDKKLAAFYWNISVLGSGKIQLFSVEPNKADYYLGSFSIEEPGEEFTELERFLTLPAGQSTLKLLYTGEGEMKVDLIKIKATDPGYDRSAWTAVAKAAEGRIGNHPWSGTGVLLGDWTGGYPILAIDDDIRTGWHNQLQAPRPFYIVVDMKEPLEVESIQLIPGPQGDNDANDIYFAYFQDLEFYVTDNVPQMSELTIDYSFNKLVRMNIYDDWRAGIEEFLPNINEGAPTDWGEPLATEFPDGTVENFGPHKELVLTASAPKTGRYLIVAGDRTESYLSIGDLRVFGNSTQTVTQLPVEEQTSTSYYATPFQLPAYFEAEEFNKGPNGIAYYAADPSEGGEQNSIRQDVDLPIRSDGASDYIVLKNRGVVAYSVVLNTGKESELMMLTLGLNSDGDGTLYVRCDGDNIAEHIVTPSEDFQYPEISLVFPSGAHILYLYYVGTGEARINDLDFSSADSGYDRSLWSAVAKAPEGGVGNHDWSGTGVLVGQWKGGYPMQTIDNDVRTAWHNNISSDNPAPFYVVVDMLETLSVNKIEVVAGPHGDGSPNDPQASYFKNFELYLTDHVSEMTSEYRPDYSMDKSLRIQAYDNWRAGIEEYLPNISEGAPAEWGDIIASSYPDGTSSREVFELESPIEGRYLIVSMNSNHDYSSIGDIRVFGDSEQKITMGVKKLPVVSDKTVKSVRYYDLMGRSVRANATGLILKHITYTDGTTGVQKMFVRQQ